MIKVNGCVETKLKKDETGYGFVEKYVKRYWDMCVDCDVLVAIETSYNGVQWRYGNQTATTDDSGSVIWMRDWWEGELYIRVYGIKDISEVDVYGGLFEEVANE